MLGNMFQRILQGLQRCSTYHLARYALCSLSYSPYSLIFPHKRFHAVDGSEIRRSPVDMVNIALLTGFYTC